MHTTISSKVLFRLLFVAAPKGMDLVLQVVNALDIATKLDFLRDAWRYNHYKIIDQVLGMSPTCLAELINEMEHKLNRAPQACNFLIFLLRRCCCQNFTKIQFVLSLMEKSIYERNDNWFHPLFVDLTPLINQYPRKSTIKIHKHGVVDTMRLLLVQNIIVEHEEKGVTKEQQVKRDLLKFHAINQKCGVTQTLETYTDLNNRDSIKKLALVLTERETRYLIGNFVANEQWYCTARMLNIYYCREWKINAYLMKLHARREIAWVQRLFQVFPLMDINQDAIKVGIEISAKDGKIDICQYLLGQWQVKVHSQHRDNAIVQSYLKSGGHPAIRKLVVRAEDDMFADLPALETPSPRNHGHVDTKLVVAGDGKRQGFVPGLVVVSQLNAQQIKIDDVFADLPALETLMPQNQGQVDTKRVVTGDGKRQGFVLGCIARPICLVHDGQRGDQEPIRSHSTGRVKRARMGDKNVGLKRQRNE